MEMRYNERSEFLRINRFYALDIRNNARSAFHRINLIFVMEMRYSGLKPADGYQRRTMRGADMVKRSGAYL